MGATQVDMISVDFVSGYPKFIFWDTLRVLGKKEDLSLIALVKLIRYSTNRFEEPSSELNVRPDLFCFPQTGYTVEDFSTRSIFEWRWLEKSTSFMERYSITYIELPIILSDL